MRFMQRVPGGALRGIKMSSLVPRRLSQAILPPTASTRSRMPRRPLPSWKAPPRPSSATVKCQPLMASARDNWQQLAEAWRTTFVTASRTTRARRASCAGASLAHRVSPRPSSSPRRSPRFLWHERILRPSWQRDSRQWLAALRPVRHARSAPLANLSSGTGGIALEQFSGKFGFQNNHRKSVTENIVQIAGDAFTFRNASEMLNSSWANFRRALARDSVP